MSNRVIKFSASWCGPCQTMKPFFKDFQEKVKDAGVEVVDLDIDEEENLQEAKKYSVSAVPTIVFIKDGKAEKRLVGMQSSQKMMETFQQVFPA